MPLLFLRGDMPGFSGFHILFAIGFFLAWLALIAGAFVLLYLVIRMAVTRGILRADALRATPAHHPVAHPAAPATPAATAASPTSSDLPISPFERRADDTDPSI